MRANKPKPLSLEEANTFPIPESVFLDSWLGFVDMRYMMGWPLTQRAVAMILKELERLRLLGFNPGEVLDQSTVNDYRGVFPLHDNRSNGNGRQQRKPTMLDSIRDSQRNPLFD